MRKLHLLIVPAMLALAVGCSDSSDEGTDTSSSSSTSTATDSSGGETTDDSTTPATDDATDDMTDDATGGMTDDATDDMTDDATDDMTDDATDDATDDVTDGATDETTDTGTSTDPVVVPETIEVTGNIDADTTWKGANTYILKSHVFVNGGTLTIEAGATVKGETGTSLVVTRDAKLNAVGTPDKPIVFTSAKAAGERAPGDWGGVVLLGKAPINVSGGENKIEGFPNETANTQYGTTGTADAAHDCGKLKYARIEFAGFQLAADNELNSLTVGGCGSATEIDYVQTLLGADDGVEMFGGTANLKHIVISQPNDDGLDWDFGWQGKVQFLVVQQSDVNGNVAFESDSNKNTPDALPRSNPTIYNATLVGSNVETGLAATTQFAMHLRRGTAGQMFNFVVTGFADKAIDIDGAQSVTQFNDGNLFVKNSILHDLIWTETDNDSGLDEYAELFEAALNNSEEDPKLADAFSLTAPDFSPTVGSPALTGGATPPTDSFFDATATFRGAIGESDWTAGWTAFPEN